METIRLTKENFGEAATRAAAVLRAGGILLYPTDTLYGLGADAFSDEAVAKVYAIKGRDEKKPIHCVVADLKMVETYADVNDAARKLAQQFLPGPLTLVLKKKTNVDFGIARGIETVGIRIPDNEFCLDLAKKFGPYTTTSANVASAQSERTVEKILEQLGERASIIDLAVDAGELPERKASTVVDASSGAARVLREGAIPAEDVLAIPGLDVSARGVH